MLVAKSLEVVWPSVIHEVMIRETTKCDCHHVAVGQKWVVFFLTHTHMDTRPMVILGQEYS